MRNENKIVVIAGAGPAGLTAAYELLTRTDLIPYVVEKSADIGGISKTVNYKGNRIDIGGHRFYSKSDRVMDWWLQFLPLEGGLQDADSPDKPDLEKVMLLRKRHSRIFFMKKFFRYPLNLSVNMITSLGFIRSFKILCSYTYAKIRPLKTINTLEDFFISKFGRELYHTFFKDYTEKVWGISCGMIHSSWGAQRIKGLSVTRVIHHALNESIQNFFNIEIPVSQKNIETSLIESFLYPKYGPGQMWEEVAKKVLEMGGGILTENEVIELKSENKQIKVIHVKDKTGAIMPIECRYFFSTMPVKQLISAIHPMAPVQICELAQGLCYRDFLTVGILLLKSDFNKDAKGMPKPEIKDNWIYIHDGNVKVGRLQIFNNWSPFMVENPDYLWLGMEYFCNQGDVLWNMEDHLLKEFAVQELFELGMMEKRNVIDTTVIRMEKAYPAYFGTYDQFDKIKKYTDEFDNLFLIGRNGMHKYNNSDHSMLTAMIAVDNIVEGRLDKSNIWCVNTQEVYHEEK